MTDVVAAFNCSIAHGVPELLEHIDLKWISTDEISAYEFCPADREILIRLKEMKNS